MPRSRASAKQAGASFERLLADGLAEHLDDDRIDRRVKRGVHDRGDITGLRIKGQRVVVEAKNCAKMDLGGWANEAETERTNDDAAIGLIAHKRRGKGQFLDQWVTMSMRDFIAVVTGERPE